MVCASQPWSYLNIRLSGQLLMGFFHSFIDESGKFQDHRVVSMCGVVSPDASLVRFNDAWGALLRHYELPFLHMKKALRPNVALSKLIRKQTIAERIEVLKPFADCIAENLELGIALAFDVAGFSKWNPAAKKRIGGTDDPAYLAFMRTMLLLQEYAGKVDDRVTLTCDDDQGTAWNFYQLYRRIKIVSNDCREKFVALTFADDKHYAALQAADMLGSLVRLEAYRQFDQRYYDYVPLFKHLTKNRAATGIKWRVSFNDAEKMEATGTNLAKLRNI